MAAKESEIFDDIIVSTDSKSIAKIAKKYGATVPFVRPSSISDDFSGTNDVIKHTIEWCIENKYDVDYVCGIYPTAPFLTSNTLIKGFDALVNSDAEFVFSSTGYSYPIQRAFYIDACGRVDYINKSNKPQRSQDLKKAYHDAGQFYWGRAGSFLDNIDLFSKKSIPLVLPAYLVHDIDEESDWKHAEILYAGYKNI